MPDTFILLESLKTEHKDVKRQLTETDEVREAVEQQHTETTAPLHCPLKLLRHPMQEVQNPMQHLVETCPDEELCRPLVQFKRQYAETHDCSLKPRQPVSDCRIWAKFELVEAAHATLSQKKQELRERTDSREAKAAKCQRELAELLKQLAGLGKQMQAVRDAMQEP